MECTCNRLGKLAQISTIGLDHVRDRGNMLESRDVIVKPEGFTIPPEASRVQWDHDFGGT